MCMCGVGVGERIKGVGEDTDDIGVAMRDEGRDNAIASGSCSVRMWGYLPAASPQRTPLLLPVPVPNTALNDPLKVVCNGGCGFGIAISESGKLNTWGSTTELGQCYLISGKQQLVKSVMDEIAKVAQKFDLMVRAERCTRKSLSHTPCQRTHLSFKQLEVGHTVQLLQFRMRGLIPESIRALICGLKLDLCEGDGEVFTWGWNECVPSVKAVADDSEQVQGDDTSPGDTSSSLRSSPKNSGSAPLGKPLACASHLRPGGSLAGKQTGRHSHRNLTCKTTENKGVEENQKKRKVVSFEDGQSPESPPAAEENVFSPPCLVNLDPGIKILTVAAGGRHTLALSDMGHVWGWGYGGEGQLGLGSRMRIVSSPQHIPCFDLPENGGAPIPGNYIKAIACGGRHSAVVTDAGALLTFGWGLHGQVGQGSTEDELRPCLVSTIGGQKIVGIAAGLWHTLCITDIGDIYAFGGNQFGQLGVGGNTAEMSPRLINAPLLEDESSMAVACGARHSVVLTGSGKIFAWGWNKYGQLGLGDSNNRDLPVQVTINDGRRAASVACGWWHTLASVHTK